MCQKGIGEMTDIGTIEERTVYRLANSVWHDTVVQRAIPWCTFHKRSVERGAQLLDKPVACSFHTDMRDPDYGDCVISTGGPEHKWWVDL